MSIQEQATSGLNGVDLEAILGAREALEGEMDLAAILGIDTESRNGFSAIRVSFEIDADATEEEISALVAQSQKRSAVFDIITNPTLVSASAKKVGTA